MKYHRYIVGCLGIGAFLSVVLLVAVALWLGLHALGDQSGGRVFGGIAAVVGVCWGLDLIVLIVLLALAELSSVRETRKEQGEV